MTAPQDGTLQTSAEADLHGTIAALRAERDAALAREAALAEILGLINRSPSDPAPVFDAILRKAHDIIGAQLGTLFLYDGTTVRGAAVHGYPDEIETVLRQDNPLPPDMRALIGGERFHHRHDVRASAAGNPNPISRIIRTASDVRTHLVVPLRKDGAVLGFIGANRTEVRPYAEDEIALLESFAAQAVMAIENARLIGELRQRTDELASRNTEFGERIEQQAATIDVLKAMSASPGDPQPVFEQIVRRARQLCGGADCGLFEFDGTLVHSRAWDGADAEALAAYAAVFPMVPTRGSIACRAILQREVIHIRNADEDRELLPAVRRLGGRSILSLPLMRDGRALGAISLNLKLPGGFSDSQVALLQTFAEQAVIAISSAETYRALQERTAALAARNSEYSERIAHQSATIDVLKAMSASPGDPQPVFDLIVQQARKLLNSSNVVLFDYDGALVRIRADAGTEKFVGESYVRYKSAFPMPLNPVSLTCRAILTQQIVHVPDVQEDPSVSELVRSLGHKSQLSVPLLWDGACMGAISTGIENSGGFSDSQVMLLQTFAEQAVIAITSAETFRTLQTRTSDLQQSLEFQTATSEVLKVLSRSTFDLQPVLVMVAETAARLCLADQASIFRTDGEMHSLAVNFGFPREYASYYDQIGAFPGFGPAVGNRATRERRAVHIHDVATVADYPDAAVRLGRQRTSLGVPLLREGEPIGVLILARQRVEPFTERQIELVRTFADQAVIAIENTRLLTEQREALEQQTATAEVLQVINANPGNLEPVFEVLLEKALRLCDAAFGTMFRYQEPFLHCVATRGIPAKGTFLDRPWLPELDSAMGPLVHGGVEKLLIADVADTDAYRSGVVSRVALVEEFGARSALFVALRKDEVLLGVFAIYHREVRPFTDKQVALLQNFAAQAVIAMENARLLNELRQRTGDLQEALDYQTATSEVLEVIGRSTFNLRPVLDTVLQTAGRLCKADAGLITTREGDDLRVASIFSSSSDYNASLQGRFLPSGRASTAGRVVREAAIVHIADVAADPDFAVQETVTLGGVRTGLGVPLLRSGTVIGTISFGRQRVEPFTDRQIDVVRTFADQAVIAIENTRLLTEQREALEQQTATAEVLQVINENPGNLAPVFDALLEKALRLCDAASGTMWRYEEPRMIWAATRGLSPENADWAQSWIPEPDNAMGQVVRGAPMVHIEDVADTDEYRSRAAPRVALVEQMGARTTLWIALRKEDTLLGVFTIYRREVRPFTDKQIALLQNFAAQAVIAMENARLLDEIRRRQDELRITFENMGDGVAMFDAAPRLVAWNRKFQDILDVPDGVLADHRTYDDYVRYLTERGEYGPDAEPEAQIRRLRARSQQSTVTERTRPNGRVIEVRHNPVPGGGFVLIYADITERKRSEADLRAARDAAEEASRTVEAAYRDLKAAQANLIQAEKMASLGQLTAGIAHEIKNPLNFVNNFASLSVDLLTELKETAAPGFAALNQDERADIEDVSLLLTGNLQKIVEHGKRADGIVRSMLEHSRGASGERRAVDLNTLIDEALNLAYHGARAQDQSFNITLERDFGGLTPIELAPQDMTRVFLNLISNGFYATRKRQQSASEPGMVPTLKVTTRDVGDTVEVRVRDNGTGIPADIRDKLFQPFFTTKPAGEGTGLGLSISYDIITRQHGGTITVESQAGIFTEFTVTLPKQP